MAWLDRFVALSHPIAELFIGLLGCGWGNPLNPQVIFFGRGSEDKVRILDAFFSWEAVLTAALERLEEEEPKAGDTERKGLKELGPPARCPFSPLFWGRVPLK